MWISGTRLDEPPEAVRLGCRGRQTFAYSLDDPNVRMTGPGMTADNDRLADDCAPTDLDMLRGVIAHLFPERLRPRPSRRIDLEEDRGLGAVQLGAATSALADPAADPF